MTVRQQWVMVGIVVGALGIALSVATYVMRDELFFVDVGSKAPAFEARRVDGSQLVRRLEDYKGKVVVFNVWATWCQPCVEEMPTFEALKRELPDTGIAIVAVSIDEIVGADSVRKFANNLKLTFEILLDSLHRTDRDYRTTGYPETFVIARDGTIRKKWIGPNNWASADNVALFRELLGLPQLPGARGSDTALSKPLKKS